jgi:hypothetical protein
MQEFDGLNLGQLRPVLSGLERLHRPKDFPHGFRLPNFPGICLVNPLHRYIAINRFRANI